MDLDALSSVFSQRLLWTVTIIALGLGAYWLVNRYLLLRAGRKSLGQSFSSIGNPVLLYFTTPSCTPCKTIQRPAIQQLQGRIGDRLQVIEIDASKEPDTAKQWGVLSVPTTFLIDSLGKPRYVNHGVATVDKLIAQYREIDH